MAVFLRQRLAGVMFKPWRSQKYVRKEIVMNRRQIVRGDVWGNRSVIEAAKKARVRMFCVAYVTQARDNLFRAGDVLVCDVSRKAVSCGETDPNFLLKLFQKGVAIYSCEGLHAKCAVFDSVVLLGSANMSESSANLLVELAVLQRDSELAMKVQAFIGGLSNSAEKLSEKVLKRLCKSWNPRHAPWQNHLGKRKIECSRRSPANHVVTVHERSGALRSLSEEEAEETEDKASKILEEIGFSTSGREPSWYYTTEDWGRRKPKAGDSVIIVNYNPGKNSRATVYGPAPVVMVDKKRKVHMVHYLAPDKGIPYGTFKERFDGKKSMNRFCIPDDVFESMVAFIKREKRNRARR